MLWNGCWTNCNLDLWPWPWIFPVKIWNTCTSECEGQLTLNVLFCLAIYLEASTWSMNGGGGKLLDTADLWLRADCAAASGGCRRVKACLKNVYIGCFCYRRWQYVPLRNSSWKKGLPVRLRVSTYSAVFITVGSTGCGSLHKEYLPLAQPADRIRPYKRGRGIGPSFWRPGQPILGC